jgi:hypothetical protein
MEISKGKRRGEKEFQLIIPAQPAQQETAN